MAVLAISPERVDKVNAYSQVHSSGPGMVQALSLYPKGNVKGQVWRVSWILAPPSEFATVESMMDSTLGGSGKFQYTPPEQVSERDCRFVEGSFSWRQVNGHWFEMEVLIEEL